MEIVYKKLSAEMIDANSLDKFQRWQEVDKCWRKLDGNYQIAPVHYIEDWDLIERRDFARKIKNCITNGGIAYGAFDNDVIIGFALLDNSPFGSDNQYVSLSEFYVSLPYRKKGIGKQMFDLCCKGGRILGASKIYISAHSATDSIHAYKSYGCTLAQEINVAMAEKEPFDLQLEYDLSFRITKAHNKRDFMSLLLLGDEDRAMIARYIDKSEMYILHDAGVIGEISVCAIDNDLLEIKNLAIYPQYQKMGYGRQLIEFICSKYKNKFSSVQVGTGDSPLTLPFYEKCGFTKSHIIKNFFIDNYDHLIFEDGIQLVDMVYLKKKLV